MLQDFYMISSIILLNVGLMHENFEISKIWGGHGTFVIFMTNLVLIIVSSEGMAPLGVKLPAGTMMTKFWFPTYVWFCCDHRYGIWFSLMNAALVAYWYRIIPVSGLPGTVFSSIYWGSDIRFVVLAVVRKFPLANRNSTLCGTGSRSSVPGHCL